MAAPPEAGARVSEKVEPSLGGAQLMSIDLFAGIDEELALSGGVASYLNEIVLLVTLPATSVQLPVSEAVPSSGPP